MGKKSCEKGKLMHWNAPSHVDMLTWLSLCKNVSLLVASHSILLADTVASLSLLGVLRPPGPRGPPPAARRSTLRTTSSQWQWQPASPPQIQFASENDRIPSQHYPHQLLDADGLWPLC